MCRGDSHAGLPCPAAGLSLHHTEADLVLWVDGNGHLLAVSPRAREVLGWAPGAVGQQLCALVADPALRVTIRDLGERVAATGNARATVRVPAAQGPLWLDVSASRLPTLPDAPVYVVARDVSDDLAAAATHAASEQQWRVAFEHSPIGGALLDASGDILVVNEALCQMLGARAHELSRTNLAEVLVSEPGPDWRHWWTSLVAGAGRDAVVDSRMRTTHAGLRWGRLSASVVPSPGAPRVMLQVQDITERREAELQLANRALHDGLTALPNRFLTRQWLASALEDRPGQGVGVLYCDLDRFKVVNDSLGHGAGDSLLTQVAERLRAPLRPEDLVGRVGGDEFVIVVEGVDRPEELADIAARVADSLDAPFDLSGHMHVMTLSLGGAVGRHPDRADDVLMRADMALLRAKRSGRARCEIYDAGLDHISTTADLELEDDLRMSVGADELRAHYQPIVVLSDLSVVGHEALLRWQHPELGLLPPAHFLELAESSGLIRPLGWWMLSQACSDAAGGVGGLRDCPDGWVAVNASPSQLARSGWSDDVTKALDVSGLRPGRLHLEITETALITASRTLVGELRALSERGVRIALDDFGTGYSSLSLLRQFPVDLVKIDRSFVEPILTDRSAYAIAKAVLSMCQDLGLPTVAEGIERPEQLDLLRRLGCSHGQGFLFGRPVPLADPFVPPQARESGLRPGKAVHQP